MVAVVADNIEKNLFRPDNLLRLVTRLQGNSVNLKETSPVTFNSVASYDAMGAAPRKNDKSNSATEQRVALEEDKTSLPTSEDADPQDAPRKRPVSRPGSNGASGAGSKSDAKSNMKTVDKKMEKTA